jgi:phasin family protein
MHQPDAPLIKETQMNFTAEQFTASTKSNAQAFEALTTNAYAGFEKLVELNLATSKAVLGDAFSQFQAVLGAKDPQQAFALQSSLLQPAAEKSLAYGRHVYAIATESSADFNKSVEAKLAQAQDAFNGVVENLAKNAPAGTESAVAAFKNALSTSQQAIDSAKGSAKKAAEMAEANFTSLTNQAVKVATSAAKKR